MFGSNYTPVESTPMIENGYYMAKIVRVEKKVNSVGEYLEIEVTVKDHAGCNPSRAYMNDAPTTPYGSLSLEASQKIWNQNFTKFFDNFKINRGDFNINGWVNKVGEITIRNQKNSKYKEIVLWKDKIETTPKAEAPATSPALAVNQAINSDGFPEDIPF